MRTFWGRLERDSFIEKFYKSLEARDHDLSYYFMEVWGRELEIGGR